MNTEKPERPTKRSEVILSRAAKQLAEKIVEEWGDSESTVEQLTRDLLPAIRYEEDGYAIAKKLDGYYTPNAALVEILDETGDIIRRLHQAACEKWVIFNAVEEPPVGSKVTCEKPHCPGIGEIMRNYPDGRSLVCFPEAGHIRNEAGVRGFLLEWEKLVLI